MKKRIISISIIICMLSGFTAMTAQTIAIWPNGCKAAVTFTFEDVTGMECHQWAVEQLDQYGFKATFFVVTNWNPSWDWCRSIAQNGHEIGSHSDSHPNICGDELASSKMHIEEKVGQPCLTIAYPNCNVPKNESEVLNNYLGGRICNGSWKDLPDIMGKDGPSNWAKIPCNLCGKDGDYINTTNAFVSKCNEAIGKSGWVVFGLFGFSDLRNGYANYSPTNQNAFTETLYWLDQNKKDCWVATLRDAIMYVQERKASYLQKKASDNYSQTWKLIHNLDQTLCNWDYPLSIEIPLPASWTAVKVIQGDKKIDAEVKNGNVYFNAVPNGGDIVLMSDVKGDVNADGVVDVADIAAVIDVMAGKGNSVTKATADVNGDNNVDVADIAAVIDVMAGKSRSVVLKD